MIIQAGEFLKWFNLNFEGESREELDFKESKEQIWLSTCFYAKQIVDAFPSLETKNLVFDTNWWTTLRYKDLGE